MKEYIDIENIEKGSSDAVYDLIIDDNKKWFLDTEGDILHNSNVGLQKQLTINSSFKDQYGHFSIKKLDDIENGYDILGFGESLTPMLNTTDATRILMGQQQMGQNISLVESDIPLIQTGFESVIPQLVSGRFAKKAKRSGVIKEIKPGEYIKILYDGAKKPETINIRNKKANTKRNVFLPLNFEINVTVGQKVPEGFILASTGSIRNGISAMGRNAVYALSFINGHNFLDGWSTTEKYLEKNRFVYYEKRQINIPSNVVVTKFIDQIDVDTKAGDVLLEFDKELLDTDKYIMDLESMSSDDSEEEDFLPEEDGGDRKDSSNEAAMQSVLLVGSSVKLTSPGGKIKEILIQLNTENVDKKLHDFYKKQCKTIESELTACDIYEKDSSDYYDCIDGGIDNKYLKIGDHKYNTKIFDGAVVTYFIEQIQTPGLGYKFCGRALGNKGVVQAIREKGKELRTTTTGLELEMIQSPIGMAKRKSTNMLLELYLGKIAYFFNLQIRDMTKKSVSFSKIKSYILEFYNIFDISDDRRIYNEIKSKISVMTEKKFKDVVMNSDPLQNPPFVLYTIPFHNKISLQLIKKLAKFINIPLDEKIYDPVTGQTTKKPVPVGIMHIIQLEHFSMAQNSARSTGSYNRLTGQALSGRKEGKGGIKVGETDLQTFLATGSYGLLETMHGAQADQFDAKSMLELYILKNGKLPSLDQIESEDPSDILSTNLFKVFMIGAGHDIN